MDDVVIRIEEATVDRRPLLGRLMQLYQHEFSILDGGDIGEDGLYEYKYFDHYWREKDRFPYLIYVDDRVAGFVLVNSHSVADQDIATKSIAEFFVMPSYRKKHIGKHVACRVFDMFPGNWQVRQTETNLPAQKFWRNVISEYTDGAFDDLLLDNKHWRGPMQTFNNSCTGTA